MDRTINEKDKCMCVFSKVKKCKDENGNIMLKCKKCKKIIFITDEEFNREKIMIGTTRTVIGRNENSK